MPALPVPGPSETTWSGLGRLVPMSASLEALGTAVARLAAKAPGRNATVNLSGDLVGDLVDSASGVIPPVAAGCALVRDEEPVACAVSV